MLSFCCWDDLSYGLNSLGVRCAIWQCFYNILINSFLADSPSNGLKEEEGLQKGADGGNDYIFFDLLHHGLNVGQHVLNHKLNVAGHVLKVS